MKFPGTSFLLTGIGIVATILLCVDTDAAGQTVASSVPTSVTVENNTGDLPYSTSLGSTTEHVELSSGNLIINVPFVSVPGRRMSLDFGLSYDARFWISKRIASSYFWSVETRNWLVPRMVGWTPNQGYITMSHAKRECVTGANQTTPPPSTASTQWRGGFQDDSVIVTDKHGIKHSTTAFKIGSGGCPGAYVFGNLDAPSVAADGYWITNKNVISSGVGGLVLFAPDGTSYTTSLDTTSVPPTAGANDFAGQGGPYGMLFQDKVGETDTHGNTQLNASGGTDSIGRHPVSQVVGTNQIQYRLPDSNGVTQIYTVQIQDVFVATNFNAAPAGQHIQEANGLAKVISEIDLPNGQHYGFQYDSYGYVTHIDLPSGGHVDYQWTNIPNALETALRSVTRRSVFDGSNTAVWDISYPTIGQTIVLSPPDAQGIRAQAVYAFDSAQEITSINYSNSAGGPSQKRFDMTYEYNYSIQTKSPILGKLSSIQTTMDGNIISKREFDYDLFEYPTYDSSICGTGGFDDNGCQNNVDSGQAFPGPTPFFSSHGNVTAIRDYDWGTNAHGPLLRQTIRKYLHDQDSSYFSSVDPQPAGTSANWNRQHIIRNIVSKVASEAIYDGSAFCRGTGEADYNSNTVGPVPACTANLLAQTLYTYDNGSPQTYGYKGDLTSVQRLLRTPGLADSSVSISYQYDEYGNLTSMTDANGQTTSVAYDDSWAGSIPAACTPSGSNSRVYPTLIRNPLQQATRVKYYPCSGLRQSIQDANDYAAGRAGTQYGYDLMARMTSTVLPDGGFTAVVYDDQAHTVDTRRVASPSPTVETLTQQDLLGRTTQSSFVLDPGGATTVDTTYDNLGRIRCVSNPHRSSTASNDGQICTTYDGLGRSKVVTYPDQAQVQIAYAGNKITTTDENGKNTIRSSDALGRLTGIIETNVYQTDYSHDALGNLIGVLQNGTSGQTPRSRKFTYDSLSRLITSSNPETGTICYGRWNGGTCSGGYDANGNLINKTDARGVTTTYSYDALNRLTRKSYSDGTHIVGFAYDGNAVDGSPLSQSGFPAANAVGRLSQISTLGSGVDNLFSYDAMGRVTYQSYCLPDNCGNRQYVTASYDLAGNLHDLSYPDGSKIEHSYDGAGRLNEVYGIDGQGNRNQTFLQPTTYLADGSVHVLTLGNGIQQTIEKNNRLQVGSMAVTDPFSNRTYLSHSYCYVNCATGGTANNGNIWGITDALNAARTQGFTYDGLNRITSFSLGGVANQQYQTDSFGNMSPMAGSNPINSFDPATNRISNLPCASSAAPYDAAGNQTCLTDPNGAVDLYAYDAENRIASISTQGSNNPFETYTYGADSSRARKLNADGTFTEYVYFNGQPIAEKDQTGAWTDYVYANGQKIARVEPTDVRAHLSGVRPESSSVWGVYVIGSNYSYQIKPGDKLAFRMYQHNAIGGISLGFSDGSNSDNYCVADNHGDCIGRESASDTWVNRTADLSGAVIGKTITYLFLVNFPGAPAGSYDVEVADLNIISTDGTITPFVNRDRTESLYGEGNTYRCGAVGANWHTDCRIERVSGSTTRFMLGDHLGSASMELTAGGWPVSSSQYAPFGQEINPQNTGNRYKFTAKERDSESGLDYFGARYYGSSMGRFMSPDWAAKATPVPYAKLDNPQSLNLYAYVGNNPLSRMDPDGHIDCGGKNAEGVGCQAIAKWNSDHGISPTAPKSNFPGVPVKLPNGNTVPDPHSKTGLLMSPTFDVSDVAAAGKKAKGDWTKIGLDVDLGKAVGTGGSFDYQRMGSQSDVITGGFQQLPQFRDVSNFNVGLFSEQAGMTLDQTLQTAGNFAKHFSSNYSPNSPYGLAPQTAEFIRVGWQAGATQY